MTPHNRQMSSNSWRPFTAVVGGLSTGLFALVVCTQMVQQVFAASAADVTDVDLVNRWSATDAVGNAPHKTAVQRAAAASVESGAKVSIVNFVFTPAEITIPPGESVTWTNDDGAPHGLKFHDGAKGTDLLLPGATFSRRFDRPGTYDYNCAVHPYMTGRVVVRATSHTRR
jgi:plastocyanin